jgi:hypothetical protein
MLAPAPPPEVASAMNSSLFPAVVLAVLLFGASAPAAAGLPTEELDKVVSSLPVSGTIEVDPEGRVAGYAIKDAEAYDQAVLDMLARNIIRWNFNPVVIDGVARQARFDMYLRLEAKPLDDKRYAVEIASAAFGRKEAAAPHTTVTQRDKMRPPKYPLDEMRRGVGGTVVLAMRIGPDGKVIDVVAEQTNLRAVGRPGAMQQWRKHFEQEALAAARTWTFVPPTVGIAANESSWDVRTPVVFVPFGAKLPGPGEWESYVPGLRREVPWRTKKKELADTGVDALPGGGLYPMEQPLHLLTKLNPE